MSPDEELAGALRRDSAIAADATQRGLMLKAAERLTILARLDREAATHVESVLCLRTHFTGEPPYVGWKGLGLALTETLDELDTLRRAIALEVQPLAPDDPFLAEAKATFSKMETVVTLSADPPTPA